MYSVLEVYFRYDWRVGEGRKEGIAAVAPIEAAKIEITHIDVEIMESSTCQTNNYNHHTQSNEKEGQRF